MIQISTVKSETEARSLSDAMYLEGIDARYEKNKRDEWDLWLVDMDQEKDALELMADYRLNPQAPRFEGAIQRAEENRKAKAAEEAKKTAPVFTKDNMPGWSGSGLDIGPVTGLLMALSIGITLIGSSGWGAEFARRFFFISQYPFLGWDLMLPEVQRGEIWRLITPIFLHASVVVDLGILHIVFNMMWLKDLGRAVEKGCGALPMALIVLIIGVVSNLGQYFFWGGPSFGGMSGVVYGLLGYIWLQGKLRPFSGFHVPPQVMNFMMMWLMIGFLGFMPIANGCHLVGLVTGLLLGAFPAPLRK